MSTRPYNFKQLDYLHNRRLVLIQKSQRPFRNRLQVIGNEAVDDFILSYHEETRLPSLPRYSSAYLLGEVQALNQAETSRQFSRILERGVLRKDTVNRFLDAMPATEDVLKVFDINLRQHFYCKETVVNSLNKCNVLKINDEELVVVSEMFAYEKNLSQEDACRRILDEYKLRMLILTCGTEGSYVFTADETLFLPTPEVEVADTVGAGDSFTGSFIASVLKGRTIAEAHKTAVEVAAYVCTRNGAMPLIPAAILP